MAVKNPYDKGMKKGLLYAQSNQRKNIFKQTVIKYLIDNFDLDNISSRQKEMVADKFELSISTINEYIHNIVKTKQVAIDIPIDPRLLNNVIQSEIALTFNQALNLKLPMNEYQCNDIPDGTYLVRLDFKVFGKAPNSINLFVIHCETHQKYRFTQFAFEGKYCPRYGNVDFAESYLNGRLLEIKVYHNQKGFAVISEASFI